MLLRVHEQLFIVESNLMDVGDDLLQIDDLLLAVDLLLGVSRAIATLHHRYGDSTQSWPNAPIGILRQRVPEDISDKWIYMYV